MKKSQSGSDSREEVGMSETALVPTTNGDNYLALQGEMHELKAMVDEYLEDGLEAKDLERIKVPGGGGVTWQIQSSEGLTRSEFFDGIIVGVQTTRAYWEVSYDDSEEKSPPNCSSRDGRIGVGKPGGECEICPLNSWGSGKRGQGTACGERKLVYILRPEDALPVVLSVPIMSQKNLRQYRTRLMRKLKNPSSVITRFALESSENASGKPYSKIVFAEVGPLPPSLTPMAKAYASTIKTALGIIAEVPGATQPTSFDPNDIPESSPPFGHFGKSPVEEHEKDEIPF